MSTPIQNIPTLPANPGSDRVTVIRPMRSRFDLGLADLPQYAHFIYVLFWRDIKVRYKQSVLGIAWVLVQPVAMMLVFTFVFGQMAGMPSDGAPYPIFAFTGLLPWLLFQRNLTQGSNSLVTFKNEITKIYFPRIIAPLSTFMSALFDFALSFIVLAALMLYFRIIPGWPILLLPAFILLLAATSFSIVLWLSALNVEYRDIQQIVPFVAQLWLFVTPVVYPSSIVPESLKLLYFLNPMSGVVEGFRWMILGSAPPDLGPLAVSLGMVFVLGISGLWYFNKVSMTMADRI
jgi:lipopolysaccharide transport system permease protein